MDDDHILRDGGESSTDMHKTSAYVQTIVTLHNLRDRAKDAVESWKERGLSDRLQDGWSTTRKAVSSKTRNFFTHPENVPCKHIPEKYNYVFRPKSRWELVLLSGTVCGIEFCYAAETAFVTPILLSLGLNIKFVTMIWCLSPLIGLFLTPILGSMSDSCESKFGRRRPFIMMYSIGILLGLLLVPNGNHIGIALGDPGHLQTTFKENSRTFTNKTTNDDLIMLNNDTTNVLTKKSSRDIDENYLKYTQKDLKPSTFSNIKNLDLKDQVSRAVDEEDIFPNNRKVYAALSDNAYFENEQDEFSKLIDKEMEETDYDYITPTVIENNFFTKKEFQDTSNEIRRNLDIKPNSNLNVKKEEMSHKQLDEEDIFPNLRKQLINIKPNAHDTHQLSSPKDENSLVMDKNIHEQPNNENINPLSFNTKTEKNSVQENVKTTSLPYTKSIRQSDNEDIFPNFSLNRHLLSSDESTTLNIKKLRHEVQLSNTPPPINQNGLPPSPIISNQIQPWSIAFTVIGTVLLDFCSDACQSPSRTYLLDVSIPSDHAAGLSTFTVMAGLGGSIGYAMGALHWETTFLGRALGGQVNAVFMIVTIIFLICLITTVCSFPEIPLPILRDPKMCKEYQEKLEQDSFQNNGNEMDIINIKPKRYGSTDETNADTTAQKGENFDEQNSSGQHQMDTQITEIEKISELTNEDLYETVPEQNQIQNVEIDIVDELGSPNNHPTLKEYLTSIIYMPSSLRVLCLTNLFCWMSLVCYSLYFTDFVGECVFRGDPQAAEDSSSYKLYKEGVQFGCWGMALYSISCSIYSLFIEALVKKIGAKVTYVGGQLVYSVGMLIMAITRHPVAVILLSPTAGVMYSTLFTMPYLLIAHYHCTKQFSDGKKTADVGIRGIGTDVAAVSSMVFLSQLILSLSMGSIIEAIGSNVVPVCAAAILSACGAISATKVTYLDI